MRSRPTSSPHSSVTTRERWGRWRSRWMCRGQSELTHGLSEPHKRAIGGMLPVDNSGQGRACELVEEEGCPAPQERQRKHSRHRIHLQTSCQSTLLLLHGGTDENKQHHCAHRRP